MTHTENYTIRETESPKRAPPAAVCLELLPIARTPWAAPCAVSLSPSASAPHCCCSAPAGAPAYYSAAQTPPYPSRSSAQQQDHAQRLLQQQGGGLGWPSR